MASQQDRDIAINLFNQSVLTLSQAAHVAGMSNGAFIDACDRLGVPVLRETDRSLADQIDSFEEWLTSDVSTASTDRSSSSQ